MSDVISIEARLRDKLVDYNLARICDIYRAKHAEIRRNPALLIEHAAEQGRKYEQLKDKIKEVLVPRMSPDGGGTGPTAPGPQHVDRRQEALEQLQKIRELIWGD